MNTDAPMLRFLSPSTLPPPRGYTHVVEVSAPCRTAYIAGQVGIDASGKLAGEPGDFRAQALRAFENLRHALVAVGGDFEHVAKLNYYVVNVATNFATLLEVRDRFVNAARPPASTLVEVPRLALPTLLFEVEAIAVLPVS